MSGQSEAGTHRGQSLLLLRCLGLAPLCYIPLCTLCLLPPAQLNRCNGGLHDACTAALSLMYEARPPASCLKCSMPAESLSSNNSRSL